MKLHFIAICAGIIFGNPRPNSNTFLLPTFIFNEKFSGFPEIGGIPHVNLNLLVKITAKQTFHRIKE